jgi:tetratricopeptide (TPR) repeat protein
MEPDYPPAFHLLGHYEWRCGNHARAVSAFGRASAFYQKWMKQNQVTVADCPEWVKAECYRVIALLSMGDLDTAYAAALQVAATPIPKDRPSSPGTRFLLWDGKTLPARILIHSGLMEDVIKASQALPTAETISPYIKYSLAYWWIDGLRFALEAQRLCDAGKIDNARQLSAVLDQHILHMEKTKDAAAANGERSQWQRAFRALKIISNDVHGRIAMSGPLDMRETAYNWYSSALEYQHHEPLLYAPLILTPMATRLGTFYLKTQHPDKAEDYFQRALEFMPNHIQSLTGLKAALVASEKSADAAKIEKQIQSLKEE